MQTCNTAPFLAALHQAITEPGSIGLTDGDLFFLANNACQPHERLSYARYLLYITNTDDNLQYPKAALYDQIDQLIRAEIVKFKKEINQEAFENKPYWRRLTWILNFREKQQQLEQKQILAGYKPAPKPKKAEKPTEPTMAVVDTKSAPSVEPVATAPAKPVLSVVKEVAPKQEPKYDLATPLNEKWKTRFRPDWPWYNQTTNIIHLTLEQLQDIEAEIAAEKAAGIKHPFERFDYKPQGELYDEGFFTYTSNSGMLRLPNCIYRPLIHLKESIRNTIDEQVQLGLVKGNG